MRTAQGHKQENEGTQGRRRGRIAGLCFLVVVPSSILLAGCASDNRLAGSGAGDPLVGGGPALPTARAGSQTPSPATPLPPVPLATGTGSNAALAAGVPRSLDPASDLRIGATPAASGGGSVPGAVLATSNPVLQRPQPSAEPVARSDPRSVYGPASSSSTVIATYEQAQAQLAARGVSWQRLETTGDSGEWKFTCSIPNRQNPNLRRTYEGRARTALAAVQAVLDQMDKDKN